MSDNGGTPPIEQVLRELAEQSRTESAHRQKLYDRLHEVANHLLSNTAVGNKLVSVTERQAATIAAQAKTQFDLPEVVDTKSNELANLVRVFLADVRSALQAHLDGDDRRMDEIRRHLSELLVAAKLSADNAKDAQRAVEDNSRQFTTHQREKTQTPERVAALRVFGKLPLYTQIILLILALALVFGGGTGLGRWLRSDGDRQHRRALPTEGAP